MQRESTHGTSFGGAPIGAFSKWGKGNNPIFQKLFWPKSRPQGSVWDRNGSNWPQKTLGSPNPGSKITKKQQKRSTASIFQVLNKFTPSFENPPSALFRASSRPAIAVLLPMLNTKGSKRCDASPPRESVPPCGPDASGPKLESTKYPWGRADGGMDR